MADGVRAREGAAADEPARAPGRATRLSGRAAAAKGMLRLRGAWASRAGFHTGNALVLHQGGDALFKRMVEAIDQARREILFETYIFCHDRIGQSVSAALCRAAERGVTVRVITDGLGTARLDLFKQWPAAGVDHRIYNPHVFGRQGFARTHRKLAAVDREIAFVGGINVVDDFRNGDHELPFPRWDFAIEVAGPVVAEVVQSIDKQWRRLDPAPPGERAPRPPRTVTHVATSLPASPEPCVAFVSRDNFRNRRAIENAYLVAIGRARHQILLANPYFVPGRRLRRALVIAAQRGVDVRLLVGCKEFVLLDWAVPWLYGKLLNAGVRIAEYDKTLLHGKVAVIDDWWGTVGSSNLDAFSLLVNQEANLVIVNDPALVELKRAMLAALDDATAIDGSHYTARAWWRRLGNWFAYRLYRVAMKLLTIGRYD